MNVTIKVSMYVWQGEAQMEVLTSVFDIQVSSVLAGHSDIDVHKTHVWSSREKELVHHANTWLLKDSSGCNCLQRGV